MKKCPYCAEEIQDEAVVCKHCGRDLKGGASQVQLVAPKKKTSVAAWGCLTLIVLVVVAAIAGQCGTPSTPRPSIGSMTPTSTPSSTPAPAPADTLALLSSRGYESEGGGYFIVEGEVQNISDQPLKSVAAQSSWYSKDNTLISSSEALIDYDPLLPGQKSPFKTMTRSNPQMSNYTVSFKRLFGAEIPTDDRRKAKKKK